MKHLTTILIIFVVLAMLASCSPNGAPSPTGSPTGAPGSAAAPTSEPPPSTAPVLTYDTLVDGTYYIPVYMQADSVITYGDDVSTYTVEAGGELTADEIAFREDVQLIGVVSPEADYAAQPNTRVTYDAHGFIQNIYYEVPVGSGNYQLTPEHAMDDPSALTPDELAWFTDEFFAIDSDNIFASDGYLRMMLLTSDYASPADIDLYELFYNGFGGAITDDELAQLEAAGFNMNLDIQCSPAGNMDYELKRHTGISLYETQFNGIEKFTFLEEYHAYYLNHSDTNFPRIEITGGRHTDDGVILYYTHLERWPETDMVLTLYSTDDGGYHFASNLPALPELAELPSHLLSYWLLADPDRSPLDASTFFYLEGTPSDVLTEHGALLLAADAAGTRHVFRAYTPAYVNLPWLEHLAFTDENGAWRSGENGSGCDAETAADIIDTIARTDDSETEYGTYHIPINGMEFLPETGVVLAMSGYETFLVYIEAQDPPDLMDFDPPIQLFYEYELVGFTSGEPVGFSIGLLAYNEGYGWSKLEG